MTFTYYDFFAGGGMAGLGLGPRWQCLFANEIDERKAASYRANHNGGNELLVKDVASVLENEVPSCADLLWASFPCQDLSLAGKGAGLAGFRSGSFKPFWKLVERLYEARRAPKIVALENVYGVITQNGGDDFRQLCLSLSELNYRFGALIIDAAHFLPQSRPRFFLIGIQNEVALNDGQIASQPSRIWHPPALVRAAAKLPSELLTEWVWWNPPLPPKRQVDLLSLMERDPTGVEWHSPEETDRLLGMMTTHNREKVDQAMKAGKLVVGTIYKRTRVDGSGQKLQRAEVRFDGIAGCLRTPAGGSSRQTLLFVNGEDISSRLISPREAASLMGLPHSYVIPQKYNEAYKLAGDGVAVPVVRHLSENIFEPILRKSRIGLAA